MTSPSPMAAVLDPGLLMAAHDLKADIDWSADDPVAGLDRWLAARAGRWAAEPKLDGCRVTLVIGAEDSRFAVNRSGSFPYWQQIAIPGLAGTVIDAEFLVRPSAASPVPRLSQASGWLGSGPAAAAAKHRAWGTPRLCAFDVLQVAGEDVTARPYTERRKYLELVTEWITAACPATPAAPGRPARPAGWGVELVPQLPCTADAIRGLLAAGYEGAMLKRLDSARQDGRRSWDWLKVKRWWPADVTLTGGWKEGKGSRAGTVGAVEIAVTEPDGSLRPIGHCGLPPGLAVRGGRYTAPDGTLRPEAAGMCIEVLLQGTSVNGNGRHPHYVRDRPDKTAAQCGSGQVDALPRI